MLLALAGLAFAQADQSNLQFSQGNVDENATLSLKVPLGNYKGSGIDLPITLNYSSSVWNIEHVNIIHNYSTYNLPNNFYVKQSTAQAIYSERSVSGWSTSLDLPKIVFPKLEEVYDYKGRPTLPSLGNGCYGYRTSRVTIILPDGSSHELREHDLHYQNASTIDKDGIFYAIDGSRIKFVSTHSSGGEGTGTIYLPDGTKYILGHPESYVTDKNGNTISFSETTGIWTDTIGREVYNPIPANPQAKDYPYTLPGMPGVNGGLISYTLRWKELGDALTPDEHGQTPPLRVIGDRYLPFPGALPTGSNSSNFPQPQSSQSLFQSADPTYEEEPTYPLPTLVVGKGQSEGQLFNPVVLSEIVLPDGRSYRFTYNVYGEIDKVVYPTNAYDQYEHSATITVEEGYQLPYSEARRNITSRKASFNGDGSDILEWKYLEASGSGNPIGTGENLALKKVSIIAPDKTRMEVLKYEANPTVQAPLGFIDSRVGMVVQRKSFSKSSTGLGGDLLRREITQYEQSVNTYIFNPGCQGANHSETINAGRNARPIKTVSLLFEGAGSALAQTTTFSYDTAATFTTGVDQTVVNTYNFVAVGNSTAQDGAIGSISTGSLAKTVETAYIQDSTYSDDNILALKSMVKVKDSSGNIVSQSQMLYDEGDFSPGYGRALPTSQKTWDSSKGLLTNPNAFLLTRSKFDNYGNQIESVDARGFSTFTDYDSTHTYPVRVTSSVPDENGWNRSSTVPLISSTEYEVITGVVLSTTDANDQTTHMEYDPLLFRLKKVIAPNGHQTTTEYGDGTDEETRWIKVRSQIDSSGRWTESRNWYDGAGRTYKTEKINSEGSIFTDIEYDEMGRLEQSSSPYRIGETKRWTVPEYDDLGRTTKVTSPDTTTTPTTVQFAYGLSTSGVLGTTKTNTDQAGRKRKGISDALGNMVRVIEDPDGLNLATDYVFDAQGNLAKTTQGGQNRYFKYDSLKRLQYAKHPEQEANTAFSGASYSDPVTGNDQWSAKYVYDNNGNFASTTDSLNTSVIATYDRLNRIILRDYTDSTPDVSFYYDGKGFTTPPANSIGKTTVVTSSVSENRYMGFDEMGKIVSSQQITDGETYDFSYTYDLSGTLLEKNYPSGRVVRNTLDEDGELLRVQSRENENMGFWTYADAFSYNSAGAVTKMQLGNGRWETAAYNERQQITQIGLGSTSTSTDLLRLEFAYTSSANSNDNNGSLRQQKIVVPNVGAYNGFTATQGYTYDSLNRLQSATENISGQTWKQTFIYDQYGNRTFDPNNTTTLGSCQQVVCNPTVSTANNRFSSGQGYSYDAAGNLTSDPGARQYLYDGENRQKQIKDQAGVSLGQYMYDGEGRRVKKISSLETTIFVYDGGGQLAAEYSTQTVETPQVSYLTEDNLGSPRVITNESGTVTSRKDFAAFGDETVTTERTGDLGYADREIRQDYTGYLKDIESGLEYAGARFYNPAHGRFTSVDPFTASAAIKNPQTFNRYSYVLNSPYKFTDPLGLFPAGGGGCGHNRCRQMNDSDSGFPGVSNATASDQVQSTATAAPTPPTPAPEASPPPKPAEPEAKVTTTPVPVAPAENGVVAAPATWRYNCLAWALGIMDLWIEPNTFHTAKNGPSDTEGYRVYPDRNSKEDKNFTILPELPSGAPAGTKLGRMSTKDIIKRAGGKKSTADEKLEQGQYRIMVLEDEGKHANWTHVMKQDSDGTWSSKNGHLERFAGIKDPQAFYNTHYAKGEDRSSLKVSYFKISSTADTRKEILKR
jgi:RHS repeat-associated protein